MITYYAVFIALIQTCLALNLRTAFGTGSGVGIFGRSENVYIALGVPKNEGKPFVEMGKKFAFANAFEIPVFVPNAEHSQLIDNNPVAFLLNPNLDSKLKRKYADLIQFLIELTNQIRIVAHQAVQTLPTLPGHGNRLGGPKIYVDLVFEDGMKRSALGVLTPFTTSSKVFKYGKSIENMVEASFDFVLGKKSSVVVYVHSTREDFDFVKPDNQRGARILALFNQ